MIFEMKHIVKVYDGTLRANDDVSIHLNQGEILAIVGENGAGKSTLMKVLYGLEKPTSGEIVVNGRPVKFHNPSDAMAAGIGMVQQHFMLFEDMTVAENIVFKNELHRGPFIDKQGMNDLVEQLSKQYQLDINPRALVKDCPVGLRQRIEILKILYQNANIIIFDEPTAVLTPLEVEALLETMRNLASAGKSIVLITHKLHEVMAVADRIYVMRQGKLVAERDKAETDMAELAFLMVGHQLPALDRVPLVTRGTLLQTVDLKYANAGVDVLKGISIHVDAGEIVGIAGVSGNGQSELISCITGLIRSSSGKVLVCGKDVTNRSVMEIRNAGLAHIPEDRYVWGSAGDGSLQENSIMGKQERAEFKWKGFTDAKKILEYTKKLIRDFAVKTTSANAKISELSGGNAQKLIVAREMNLDTPVLIACEPTRGIDIGATEAIHERLLQKRAEGAAILLVSSELTEIMSLSDRIYVIYNGEIRGEFESGAMDDTHLGILMVGGTIDNE